VTLDHHRPIRVRLEHLANLSQRRDSTSLEVVPVGIEEWVCRQPDPNLLFDHLGTELAECGIDVRDPAADLKLSNARRGKAQAHDERG